MSDLTIQGQVVVKEERPLLIVEKDGSGGGGEALIIQNLGTLTAATTIDAASGIVVRFEPGADISLTLKSSASDKNAQRLLLHITNGGAHVITWPDSLIWDNKTAPTFQAIGEDLVMVYTEDQGTTWYGKHVWSRNQDTTDHWDGSTGTLPTPVSGVYTITTCAELSALVAAVNSGTISTTLDVTVKLANNLDLNNIVWTPFNTFAGTIDGNGCFIKNLLTTFTSASYSAPYGGLVNSLTGTIKNLYVYGNVSENVSDNRYKLGGIAGNISGAIINSLFNGTVAGNTSTEYASIFGGIAGYSTGGAITNCVSVATITGKIDSAGGVLGDCDSATIKHCFSKCNIVTTGNAGAVAGGICGDVTRKSAISDCCVEVVEISTQYNRGSISGQSNGNVTNSFWHGSGINIVTGTNVSTAADLPVAAILLDKYTAGDGASVTALAYPTESTQAGTVEITAGSGMTVSPSEISSGAKTEITVTGTGTLTFAVPVAVLTAATNKCSPTVALTVA